jgi:hypothetical protein
MSRAEFAENAEENSEFKKSFIFKTRFCSSQRSLRTLSREFPLSLFSFILSFAPDILVFNFGLFLAIALKNIFLCASAALREILFFLDVQQKSPALRRGL